MFKKRWLNAAASSLMSVTSVSILLIAGSGSARQVPANYKTQVENTTKCSFINNNSVNIRSGPGDHYPVVAQLNRGDGVRALDRKGNWVSLVARAYGVSPHETFKPFHGWVSNTYINGCSEDKFDRWRN